MRGHCTDPQGALTAPHSSHVAHVNAASAPTNPPPSANAASLRPGSDFAPDARRRRAPTYRPESANLHQKRLPEHAHAHRPQMQLGRNPVVGAIPWLARIAGTLATALSACLASTKTRWV